MQALIRLAAQILAQGAADRAQVAARRAALLALAGLFALIAAGFAIAASWTALAQWRGPIWASLILAVGFLVVALIVWGISRRRPRHTGLSAADVQALETEAAALLAQAPEVLARHPVLPLAGAFLGGLILALRVRR